MTCYRCMRNVFAKILRCWVMPKCCLPYGTSTATTATYTYRKVENSIHRKQVRGKFIHIYEGYIFVRSKGVRSELIRDNLKCTQMLEQSWRLLGYAGFLRAVVHEPMHNSNVKYDWFATHSFRSSFGADSSKISILKGGRLFFFPWQNRRDKWAIDTCTRKKLAQISENMHEQHLFDARIRIAQHARKWTGNFEKYYYLYRGIFTYI